MGSTHLHSLCCQPPQGSFPSGVNLLWRGLSWSHGGGWQTGSWLMSSCSSIYGLQPDRVELPCPRGPWPSTPAQSISPSPSSLRILWSVFFWSVTVTAYISGYILTGTCIPSTAGLAKEVMQGSGESWRNLLQSAGVCILTRKCISAARPVWQSNPGMNKRGGGVGGSVDSKRGQAPVWRRDGRRGPQPGMGCILRRREEKIMESNRASENVSSCCRRNPLNTLNP